MPVTDAIAAEDLSVSLAGRPVLKDISVAIGRGEFVILLGGNGSGKTTLVRALLGLVQRDSGTVKLLDIPLERFTQWRKIGYVPQRLSLPTAMPATVAEVVLSGRIAHAGMWKPYSKEDRTAAARALEIVDLVALSDERVSRLSGGQQQRVLIARALATEPEVIVLDEPVSHVDIAHQIQFAQLLRDANERGVTVLLVAHALGKMSGLASRAVVLEEGRVVYDGRPDAASVHMEDVHHHDEAAQPTLRPIGGER